jgi:hypothetical protein
VLVLGVLAVLFMIFTGFYTDLLWFQSVDQSTVFTAVGHQSRDVRGLRSGHGAGGRAVNVVRLRRRPFFADTLEQQGFGSLPLGLEPGAILLVVSIVLGFSQDLAGQWKLWLLWRNATPFNVADQHFGMDVGFWVFTYPFIRFVLGFLFAVLFVMLLVNLVVNYLYGGIRLQSPGDRMSRAARVQVSLILGLMMLVRQATTSGRFGLAVKDDDLVLGFTGLKYRDVNALLPAKTILMFVALIVALLFFVNMFRKIWTVAMAGLGLMVVSALVIGGIYPAVVQQFQVKPRRGGAPPQYRCHQAGLRTGERPDAGLRRDS